MKKVFMALSFVMVFSLGNILAQTRTITGTVTGSDDGQPIPGASVFVKGTTMGTITQIDGDYSLSVPQDAAVLVFSFVGMETQERPVGAETSFNVIMVSSFADLDEVIVVGYGTMRKSDLTGAVAKVGIADLKNRATSDAAVALQGKAAGVQILSNSGAPGKAADIRVRGMSSNSDKNGPLLIVDGLKVDNIQYLDPEMIESIEILKDGASAAIYGAAAGNGVVLITTKTGSKSKESYFLPLGE